MHNKVLKKFNLEMTIFINGEERKVNEKITLYDLIDSLGFKDKKIAVELNDEVIIRSLYRNRIIVQNDKIEIITAIGGG